jgi:phosphoribosylformylglycinamidine synthase
MAVAGKTGAILLPPDPNIPAHAFWFGEEQGRYVLATGQAARVLAQAAAAGVPARPLGSSDGNHLKLPGIAPISIETLITQRDRFFAAWMGDETG